MNPIAKNAEQIKVDIRYPNLPFMIAAIGAVHITPVTVAITEIKIECIMVLDL